VTSTPLDHLIDHVRGSASVPVNQAAPVAILGSDPKAEWHSLLPKLQHRIPELLILGDYAPENRTGSAIWLRCIVDRSIDLPDSPSDKPPILYLPDVGRADLQAGQDCLDAHKPPVELTFRVWSGPPQWSRLDYEGVSGVEEGTRAQNCP